MVQLGQWPSLSRNPEKGFGIRCIMLNNWLSSARMRIHPVVDHHNISKSNQINRQATTFCKETINPEVDAGDLRTYRVQESACKDIQQKGSIRGRCFVSGPVSSGPAASISCSNDARPPDKSPRV
jgi:hypothetical protein